MEMVWIEILIGIGLGVVIIVIARAHNLLTWRALFPLILFIIALLYVGFAIRRGGAETLAINVFIALIFGAISLWGYYGSLWVIVGGLIGHGLFDAAYPRIGETPAPSWWPDFCLGVDITLALFLAYFLLKNHIAARRDKAPLIKK